MARRRWQPELPLDRPLLIRLYHEQDLSVDKLPYTQNMDNIVHKYNERHSKQPAAHYEIYQTLVTLRKSRKLVKKPTVPSLF